MTADKVDKVVYIYLNLRALRAVEDEPDEEAINDELLDKEIDLITDSLSRSALIASEDGVEPEGGRPGKRPFQPEIPIYHQRVSGQPPPDSPLGLPRIFCLFSAGRATAPRFGLM
jgi:hypothetical protein